MATFDGGVSRARVYGILAVGLVSASLSPILVRFAADAPATAVAVWRTLFAFLILAPVAVPMKWTEIRKIPPRDRRLIVMAGVALGAHFIVWIESLYFTSIASATVLFTTNPIFIAVFGYMLLNERLSRRTVLAIVAGVLGSTLIGFGDRTQAMFPDASTGNLLALLSAILFGAYLLVGRVVRPRTEWLTYVFPLYGVVALTALVYAVIRGLPLVGYGPVFFLLCLAMAVFPSILGHGSFNYVVKFMPAAVVGLFGLSEPVIASGLAYVLFGEIPGPIALLGMVIVLVAVAAIFGRRLEE